MKTIYFTLAATCVLTLNSCVQCYNERYCQDMIGQPIASAVAEIGAPTSVTSSAGVTVYTWFTDQSYTSTYTRPARETHWEDSAGRLHSEYRPAEVVSQYNSEKAELTFMVQNDTIVNYRTNSDYDMCNAFIPQYRIQAYIAADEAAKAAR